MSHNIFDPLQVEMFVAEALGLKQMYGTQTIRIPQPICWGVADNSAYLVMEWLEFGRGARSSAWEAMGSKLAAMHRFEGSKKSVPVVTELALAFRSYM